MAAPGLGDILHDGEAEAGAAAEIVEAAAAPQGFVEPLRRYAPSIVGNGGDDQPLLLSCAHCDPVARMARRILKEVAQGFREIVRVYPRNCPGGNVDRPVETTSGGCAPDDSDQALDDLGDVGRTRCRQFPGSESTPRCRPVLPTKVALATATPKRHYWHSAAVHQGRSVGLLTTTKPSLRCPSTRMAG